MDRSFEFNSDFSTKTIIQSFKNAYYGATILGREAEINKSINDMRNVKGFSSFFMDLYMFFTSKIATFGFLGFILIFTIISYNLIYKKRKLTFKLFIYPVFLMTLIKTFCVLSACFLISRNLQIKNLDVADFKIISPFELYNSSVFVLEMIALYLLNKMLFSKVCIKYNIVVEKFINLMNIMNIITPTIFFIAIKSPELSLSPLILFFLFGYLIYNIFLPIHIYYIYKIGLFFINSYYVKLKDNSTSKKFMNKINRRYS